MDQLFELATQIRDTLALIMQHEQAAAEHPSPSLSASLRSLRKRLDRLVTELAAENSRQMVEAS